MGRASPRVQRRRMRIWMVLGIVAVLIVAPLLAVALTSPNNVGAGATFNATSGPEVVIGEATQSDLSVVFPDDETVRIGETTVTGAEAQTTLFVDQEIDGIENATFATLDPAVDTLRLANDEAEFDIEAVEGIDEMSLSTNASVLDDGIDMVVTGSESTSRTIELHNLDTDEITVLDEDGSTVTTETVDDGSATVSVEEGTQQLTVVGGGGELSGFVEDVEDVRIEGATVTATLDGETTTTTTNSTGGYSLTLDETGLYDIEVDAGAFGNTTGEVFVDADMTANWTVTVGERDDPDPDEGVALQLVDAPDDDENLEISAPGIPVEDATIAVYDDDGQVDSNTTDSDGWAELDISETKEYVVDIEVGGEVRRSATLQLENGSSTQTGVGMTAPVLLDGTASPDGEIVSETEGDNITLEINADDADFPQSELTVEFYRFDTGDPEQDELLATDTLTSTGTATGEFELTEYVDVFEWYAVVTDPYAYSDGGASSVFSFELELPEPTIENLNPDGDPVSPGETITLSADVGHGNIDETDLDVTFYQFDTGDPSVDPIIDQQTVSTEGTVTADYTVPVEPGPHQWYVTVEDDDGGFAITDAAVLEFEAEFDVDILSAPGAATGGDSIDVEVLIQNVGGASGSEEIEILWDGAVVDTIDVALDPIIFDDDGTEFVTEIVTIQTDEVSTETDIDVTIQSEADSDSETVTVSPTPDALSIELFDAPTTAASDSSFTTYVTVRNDGTSTFEDAIVEFLVDESQDGDFTSEGVELVTLDPGEETTVSFDYEPTVGDGDAIDVRATTATDIESSTVNILDSDLDGTITNVWPADDETITVEELLTEPLSFDVDPDQDVDEIIVRVYDTTGEEAIRLDTIPRVVEDETTTITTRKSLAGAGFDVGENDWQIELEDSAGREDIHSFSFSVNATLEIREEVAPGQQITDAVDVTIREQIADDPVIFSETVTDGEIVFDGVSASSSILIDLEAEGYYDRSIVFPSVPAQDNIYLLDDNVTSTAVTAVLEGGAINPAQADIMLQRALPVGSDGDLTYETIAGDEFGSGAPTFQLETGERYRAILLNREDGSQQNLGTFVALGEEQTIGIDPGVSPIERPGDVETWFADGSITRLVDDLSQLDDGDIGERIEVTFLDETGETTLVELTIHERGNSNNTLFEEILVTPTAYSTEIDIEKADTGKEWVANWTITRDGETHHQEDILTVREDITDFFSTTTATIIGIGMMLLLGGLFSVLSVGVGAVVTALVGGLLWWLGWLGAATSGIGVIIAIAMAVVYYMATEGPR